MTRGDDGWYCAEIAGAGPAPLQISHRRRDRRTRSGIAHSSPTMCSARVKSSITMPIHGARNNGAAGRGKKRCFWKPMSAPSRREGTYRGMVEKLDHLVETGITALELMPLADFAGSRTGVMTACCWYAPDSAYGRPEDLKALIDEAHLRGLMVLLDVVYNHFGPEGNYLGRYAPNSSRKRTRPGAARSIIACRKCVTSRSKRPALAARLSLRRAAAGRRQHHRRAGESILDDLSTCRRRARGRDRPAHPSACWKTTTTT